jgi:hypothetical protein
MATVHYGDSSGAPCVTHGSSVVHAGVETHGRIRIISVSGRKASPAEDALTESLAHGAAGQEPQDRGFLPASLGVRALLVVH